MPPSKVTALTPFALSSPVASAAVFPAPQTVTTGPPPKSKSASGPRIPGVDGVVGVDREAVGYRPISLGRLPDVDHGHWLARDE
jgi:hypothetical protein